MGSLFSVRAVFRGWRILGGDRLVSGCWRHPDVDRPNLVGELCGAMDGRRSRQACKRSHRAGDSLNPSPVVEVTLCNASCTSSDMGVRRYRTACAWTVWARARLVLAFIWLTYDVVPSCHRAHDP